MYNGLEKNPLTINDSTKSPKDYFHSDLVNNWSDPRCGTCQYKEMGKLLKFGNNVFIINHFPHHGHFFFLTQFNKRIVVVLVLKVWIWKFLNCNKLLAMFRNAELSYRLAFWIFIYITWFWMRAVVQWNWRQFYGNIQEVRKIYAHVK